MKRVLVLGAALACVSAAAFAASGIKIVNQSKVDIDHLYTSAPGKNAWGDDLLAGGPDAPLDAGKTYTVEKLTAGTFDLKLVDDDGNTQPCVLKAVKIKAGAPLKITKKMTAACL